MFYQGVVAFILLAQTVGLTVEQIGAELPNVPQCDSGYAVNVAPEVCYHPEAPVPWA